ncbi:MAG: hypothetical protein R3B67_13105 [Phycisphaerales bacterium]
MQNHNAGRELAVGSRWRIFPATTTLGFYDSFAQYIELSAVSSVELREAIDGDALAAIKCLPLLAHELQHWADHLSTLWGRQRLIRSLEAMDSRRSNDPEVFWKITDYLRLLESDYFSTYYQTIGKSTPQIGPSRPWAWQLTAGMRFDVDGRLAANRPIFFTQFAWPDGSHACRVPFSVSALLEARAMAAELSAHFVAASNLPEAESKVEQRIASEKLISRLYNPELAVYSVGAHLVGNLVGLKDAMQAFQLASQIAHVSLDLPKSLFSYLKIPNDFEPWKTRVPGAIESMDRGFVFLLLLFHAKQIGDLEVDEWLSEVLLQSGLPTIAEIREASDSECVELRATARVEHFAKRLDFLWDLGEELRKTHSYLDEFGGLGAPLPPVYCNDLEWVLPSQYLKFTTADELEEWWETCNKMAMQFEEFRDACGI